jgi:hypothetical protein
MGVNESRFTPDLPRVIYWQVYKRVDAVYNSKVNNNFLLSSKRLLQSRTPHWTLTL